MAPIDIKNIMRLSGKQILPSALDIPIKEEEEQVSNQHSDRMKLDTLYPKSDI